MREKVCVKRYVLKGVCEVYAEKYVWGGVVLGGFYDDQGHVVMLH